MDKSKIIDSDLPLESLTVNLCWFAEVDRILDARIQVYAVNIRVFARCPWDHFSVSSLSAARSAYSCTNPGMLLRSPISTVADAVLSLPCSLTKASRRFCRRPTATTFEPSLTNRLAIAVPMPEVAPITKTCLYNGEVIFKTCVKGFDCWRQRKDLEIHFHAFFIHSVSGGRGTSLYPHSNVHEDSPLALSPSHTRTTKIFLACLMTINKRRDMRTPPWPSTLAL